MKQLFKKTIATLLSLTLILSWAAFARDITVNAGSYATASFYRVQGTDRYDTANKIAAQGWDEASTVVLASGMSYPDALAGAPLAYALDAPILLVTGSNVPASVMQQIYDLGASNIYILGGTAAVSSSIEQELKGKNFTVNRIWGQNRYETSVEVAKTLISIAGSSDEAFVVSGENYPDALAVSPVASLKGAPIVYSNKRGTIDSGSAALLRSVGASRAYVIGGTAAIGSDVNGNLGRCGISSITRISGNSRYDTALKVADHFIDVFTAKSIAFATGENYPDALAGGVFAARKGMPVLLTNSKLNAQDSSSIFLAASAYNDSLSFTENLVAFIEKFQPEEVFVFGGQNAVPNVTIDSYFDGETWEDTTTTTTTTTTKAPTTATTSANNGTEGRTFNLRRTLYMMEDEYDNVGSMTDADARNAYIAENGKQLFFESDVTVTDRIGFDDGDNMGDKRKFLTEAELREVNEYVAAKGGEMPWYDLYHYVDDKYFPDTTAYYGGMYVLRDKIVDSSGVLEVTGLKTNTLYRIEIFDWDLDYSNPFIFKDPEAPDPVLQGDELKLHNTLSPYYQALNLGTTYYAIYLSDEDYDKYVGEDGYWDGNFALRVLYSLDVNGNEYMGW